MGETKKLLFWAR